MPERRLDLESRRRIVQLERRYDRVVARVIRAVAIIGITLVLVSAVLVLLVRSSDDQADRLEALAREQQASRVINSREVCRNINGNLKAISNQSDYLADRIVESARQSKVFEGLYAKVPDAPSYKQRVAEAKRLAKGLRATQRPPLDCDALIQRVQDSGPKSELRSGEG